MFENSKSQQKIIKHTKKEKNLDTNGQLFDDRRICNCICILSLSINFYLIYRFSIVPPNYVMISFSWFTYLFIQIHLSNAYLMS